MSSRAVACTFGLVAFALVLGAAAPAHAGLHTDVCLAARDNDVKKLKRLLPKLEDLDAGGDGPEEYLPPVIVCAARAGALEVVKLLVARGAKLVPGYWIAEKNDANDTVAAAGGSGNLELMKWLLADGRATADHAARASAMTAVHTAAAAGHLPMIELLLARGAKLDVADAHRRAPLHHAVSGKPDVVAFLLARGAKLDAQDALGQTPLLRLIGYSYTSVENRLAILDQLLAAKAQLELADPAGRTPLLAAVECEKCPSREQVIERLINAGASANATLSKSQVSLLMLAVQRDDAKLVERLLARKADPNFVTAYGPPLFEARSQAVADLLFAAGAKANARDAQGRTALTSRVVQVSNQLMMQLLDRGADPLAVGGGGVTPLMAASQLEYQPVMKRVLAAGAPVDARDQSGTTALIYAASSHRDASVAILLAHKADPTLRDPQGFTALDHARQRGATVAARALAKVTPNDPAYPRFPYLSTAPLTAETLEDFSTEELVLARNELYARRGYRFKNAELAAHFAAQRWYQPDPAYDEQALTPLERENIRLLLATEKARKAGKRPPR